MKYLVSNRKNLLVGVDGKDLQHDNILATSMAQTLQFVRILKAANNLVPENIIIVGKYQKGKQKTQQLSRIETQDFVNFITDKNYDWFQYFENPDPNLVQDILKKSFTSLSKSAIMPIVSNMNDSRKIKRIIKEISLVDLRLLMKSAKQAIVSPISYNGQSETSIKAKADYEREMKSYNSFQKDIEWDDSQVNKAQTGDLFAFVNTSTNYNFVQIHRIKAILPPDRRRDTWDIQQHQKQNVLILGDIEYYSACNNAWNAYKPYKPYYKPNPRAFKDFALACGKSETPVLPNTQTYQLLEPTKPYESGEVTAVKNFFK